MPKFMLVKLEPASGTVLAARGGTVSQKVYVNNTQHGVKPLVMRLRITFTLAGGQSHEELAEVANFPPGF